MDFEMHKKYEESPLPQELRMMFSELIGSDDATKKIFLLIAQHSKPEVIGITIKQITDKIRITRKKQKGKKFEETVDYIDRKHAERVVDKLLLTGLCYYQAIPPSKVLKLTKRGMQVASEIMKNQNQKERNEHVHE